MHWNGFLHPGLTSTCHLLVRDFAPWCPSNSFQQRGLIINWIEVIINLYVRKEKFHFLIFMPVHFTPMRWENGSPFEKIPYVHLTASWAAASEHSLHLRQSEKLKYKMHVLWHLPWMKKNQQYLLRHIGKRAMKATITESKLFPGLQSLFPVKRRQICEGI